MNTENSAESRNQVVPVCCGPISNRRALFWGGILIVLGAALLLDLLLPLQHFGRFILPAFLMLWGAAILLARPKA